MHYCFTRNFTKVLAAVIATAIMFLPAGPLLAGQGDDLKSKASTIPGVPSANTKTPGFAVPNVLSPELTEAIVAQGSWKLENPSDLTNYYGYDNDGPMLPAAGDLPSATHKVEASKTEPDKNTYLVLRNQHGADAAYDYGKHFLFQGHEL